jgi:hypothetical protein
MDGLDAAHQQRLTSLWPDASERAHVTGILKGAEVSGPLSLRVRGFFGAFSLLTMFEHAEPLWVLATLCHSVAS